jgi:hypothetical protein
MTVELQLWWLDATNRMRDELLERLTDADLAFTPGGENLPLGELIRQMGEVEQSYIDGLTRFAQDFSYRNSEEGLAGSVSRLTDWSHALDTELIRIVSALSDADLERTVTREGGFEMPVGMSIDVYVQAQLIFFGKASVYFKAMGRELPPSVNDWIW